MTLHDLSERYWRIANEMAPTVATVRGVHDFDHLLARFDDEWRAEMSSRLESIIDAVAGLDERGLTVQERVTRSLLTYQCETALHTLRTPFLMASLDPFLGPHTRLLSDTRQNTVQSLEQANALLERYRSIPAYLGSALATHIECASVGMTPSQASLSRVISQIEGYLSSPLADDPFLVLAVPEDGDGWRDRAATIVRERVRTAFADYLDGLNQHIRPVARPDDRCGLVWMPGGEEIYAHLIRRYTQLEAPASQIHEIGQKWATEINAEEWIEIGGAAFGATSIAEVFQHLHDDPDLRFRDEEHMLEHARTALDRAWEAIDPWFGTRPETPCNVVPVPSAVAPAMPPAYYSMPPVDGSRPGTYFLNTYKPEERDLFEYESIHFHEGIPGHHFDRSLAAELDGIPTFRRYSQVYAHTEGWGLYSERLADEMGLYSAETDRLGMVSADAWRAGRLVTDTGMHALGWSRQQGIEFLREWTPIGLLTVEQEIDRYIGMPGQALSYKMGQLEIMRLRESAEAELGDRFDIKGFHDVMLTHGAMPLPMLAVSVDEWIEAAARAQASVSPVRN